MRKSGFDTSFRFGPFSGSTDVYAPVCLNSLLYKYERDMAHFASLLGHKSEATQWEARATARREAINKYLWNPTTGLFYDYNVTTNQPSTYNSLSAYYPLWAGLVTPAQAASVEHHLSLFEHDGGLAMSDNASGTQWDLPFGWAPTNWLTTKGLTQYGFNDDAKRIANHFMQTVRQNFERDGTIREKYNVVNGSANIQVAAGYKSNVVGFGWTNGVFLQMNDLLTHQIGAMHQKAKGETTTAK
jgi:alpha,alpha-trehalase